CAPLRGCPAGSGSRRLRSLRRGGPAGSPTTAAARMRRERSGRTRRSGRRERGEPAPRPSRERAVHFAQLKRNGALETHGAALEIAGGRELFAFGAPGLPGDFGESSAGRRDVFAARLALFGGERARDVGGNRDRG